MITKLLAGTLFSILLSSSFATEPNNTVKEPDFLDKATEMTNRALSSSKQIAKDVIDKTTVLTNKAIDSSKKIGKDVIDKATEVTNNVLAPKDKKNCSCNSSASEPSKTSN